MVLSDGMLATVSRGDPGGSREVTEQRCDRVYAAAGTDLLPAPGRRAES